MKMRLNTFLVGACLSLLPSWAAAAGGDWTPEPYACVNAPVAGDNVGYVGDMAFANGALWSTSTIGVQPRLLKLDPAGNLLNSVAPGFGSQAIGIAVNASAVYVLDHSADRVVKMDFNFNQLSAWGSSGNAPGRFQTSGNGMAGIAADESYVYVADWGNQRIQKFDLNGVFVTAWSTPGEPSGIAVKDGQIWAVIEPGVFRYDTVGNDLGSFNIVHGIAPGQMWLPVRIKVGCNSVFVNDEISYSESADGRHHVLVQEFTFSGSFVRRWEVASRGMSEGSIITSFGFAAGAGGVYYGDGAGVLQHWGLCDCVIDTPTVTPTDCGACSSTPTLSVTRSPTVSATLTYTPTATPSPSPTATATFTPMPSLTVSTTATPTVTTASTPAPSPASTAPGVAAGDSYPYPSPANGSSVNFAFTMPAAGQVHLQAVSAAGDLLSEIWQAAGAGSQSVALNISGYAPGIYYYRLELISNGSTVALPLKSFAIVR